MSDLNHYYAVIMAGGGGTRLWPLSRQDRPKQSLPLLGDRTMFQIAVQRLAPLFPPERILVVTNARYAPDLQRQSPELPAANFIIEPGPRGTAPAIALAAQALQQRSPAAVMACLTADHYIGQEARFRDLLAAAAALAEADYLVTLGIAPTFAATGFGYIQRGGPLGLLGRGEEESAALRRTPVPPGRSPRPRPCLGSSQETGRWLHSTDRCAAASSWRWLPTPLPVTLARHPEHAGGRYPSVRGCSVPNQARWRPSQCRGHPVRSARLITACIA